MASPLSSMAVPPEGPLPAFLNVDEKYLCALCRKVLRQAVQSSCGHHMCEPCVNEYLAEKDVRMCPVGGKDCQMLILNGAERSIFPDISVRREVMALPVICSNQRHGCTEAIPWKHLQEHEKGCQHAQIACSYGDYGCNQRVSKVNLQRHLEECEHRPTECRHCGTKVGFSSMEKHKLEDCPKMSVSCPYSCGAKNIIRELLAEHKSSCTHRPRKCFYSQYGCQYQGIQAELKLHNQEHAEDHVGLLAADHNRVDLAMVKMQRELKEVRDERDLLRTRLEHAERTNTKLTDTISRMERRLQKLEEVQGHHHTRMSTLEVDVKHRAKSTVVEAHGHQLMMLAEAQRAQNEQVADLSRQGSLGGTMPDTEVSRKVSQCEHTLATHDVRLAEMDLRFQLLETASYNGTLLWKIRDYTRRKQDAISGRVVSLYSQPFYTGRFGYKMCARVYLNGDGSGKGTHLSFFFALMKGEYDPLLPWPFRQKVTLMLLDQESGTRSIADSFRPDVNSSSFQMPTREMNVASGCPTFVAHSVLEKGTTYIKDDTLYLKVVVDTTDLYGQS